MLDQTRLAKVVCDADSLIGPLLSVSSLVIRGSRSQLVNIRFVIVDPEIIYNNNLWLISRAMNTPLHSE